MFSDSEPPEGGFFLGLLVLCEDTTGTGKGKGGEIKHSANQNESKFVPKAVDLCISVLLLGEELRVPLLLRLCLSRGGFLYATARL